MSKIQLFCLPYAGGSATIYSKWKRILSADIELYPVELAGRGRRFNESPYDNVEQAIEDIYREIGGRLHTPFALFGHSMGSLLTYELCCKIKQLKGVEPVHIFASGRRAPQCPHDRKVMHLLPEAEFMTEVHQLGGTPRELFENRELAEIFMPLLRADYKLVESYAYYEKNVKFDCDLTVLNGKEDDMVPEHLTAWGDHTNGSFKIVEYDGGHFFIHDHTDSIVKLINETLSTVTISFSR
ncbi:thioesterase [Paenibacillus tyrfis]|uniref:thioesterase II family protein n=1 Tax=Paenibacillus tyrfis TaxID=1501230 RepID=UPI002491E14C|nr:alpha/beta fold hydrolase [Paenibacillus tyrfis]GLI08149.1 thioesterase [Paenibacillus tyrfis]